MTNKWKRRGLRLQPEILTQPPIPESLHGINPRSILGPSWWETQKEIANKKNDFCCWTCGVSRSKTLNGYLESHEIYHFDFDRKTLSFERVSALCGDCHNFVHPIRLLFLFQKGEISSRKFRNILRRGLKILSDNELKPFPITKAVYMGAEGYGEEDIDRFIFSSNTPDLGGFWTLNIEGVEYKGSL
jgi:hypothetical protein